MNVISADEPVIEIFKGYFYLFQTRDYQQIVITCREFKYIKQYQGQIITEIERKLTTKSGHLATQIKKCCFCSNKIELKLF